MLRVVWHRMFKEAWILTIVLFILLFILRAYGILGGNEPNYKLVMLGFLLMWFIPIIFLNKNGRNKIGIKKSANRLWLMLSPLLGILSASDCPGYLSRPKKKPAMNIAGDPVV